MVKYKITQRDGHAVDGEYLFKIERAGFWAAISPYSSSQYVWARNIDEAKEKAVAIIRTEEFEV
jgi:hypothetical protein